MTRPSFTTCAELYLVTLCLALLTLGTISGAIGVYCLARSVFG